MNYGPSVVRFFGAGRLRDNHQEIDTMATRARVIQFSITSDEEDGLDVVVQVRRPAPGKMIRRGLSCPVGDIPPDIREALQLWLNDAPDGDTP